MRQYVIDGDRHPRVSLFLRTQSAVTASFLLLLLLVVELRVPLSAAGWLLPAIALIALTTVLALALPWERWPASAQALPAGSDLVAVGCVCVALYGHMDNVALLAVLPAVWMAIVAGTAGMLTAIAGAYACALVPVLVTPGARDPAQWASALFFMVVVPVLIVVSAMLTARYRSAAREIVHAYEQRNAAAAESERLGAVMQSFAEEIDLGLVVFGPRGEPVLSNDAIRRFGDLARHREGSDFGTRVFAADQVTPLSPEDQPIARLRRGEVVEDLLYWVGPRGGQRALVANGRSVKRADGRPAGAVLAVQDVTELLRAGRTREDALATLAHELRTPLTSIVGYADLLAIDELPPAAADRVEVIARNAEHLLSLTATFLDGLHGHGELNRERWSVRELVEAGVDVLLTTPGFAERELSVDVSESLCVPADREGVIAVLTNLLGNAVKFSRPGDRITITGGQDDEHVSLTVHNTGSRVDPSDLERIFDRFYRGGNARRAAIPGTGIGLSVSREIAQAHGGSLSADAADDGASFTLCLPRE